MVGIVRYLTVLIVFRRIIPVFCMALALVSCSRDPQVLKKKYLETGNKYFDRGKFKEAAIMYRRSLSADPKYGAAYYKLASTFLRLGQPANAYPSLRRAVELLPVGSKESNDANLNLAELLLDGAKAITSEERRKPYMDDVQSIAKQFLSRDPNSYEGHKLTADLQLIASVDAFRKSNIPLAKELLNQAILDFRKALSAHPGDPAITLSLARSLAMNGNQEEAEQLFRADIDKSPNAGTAYVDLYKVYISQHKLPEGEALLKKAVEANPKDASFRILLAAHYFTNQMRPEGEKVLDGMKSDLKSFPQAYMTAGDFYLRSGDSAKAIQQYEDGEAKDKAHKVDYQKRVIGVLVQQGKTPEAYAKNLEILKDNPKDPEARGTKATFLLDKGDVSQALNELQAVVNARPDNFVARFQLGRAHYAKREYEQARQEFEKSVQLRADYLPPRLALAQVALVRNDNGTALKRATEALKISPQNGAGKLLQSAAQMRMGDFKDARETLDGILAVNPKQTDTLLEIGVLSLMEKKYSEAVTQFRRAYEVDPANAKGLLGESEAYLLQNKPDEALRLVQAEVNRYPNRNDIKRDLADLELRTQHYDQAIASFRSLVPTFKDNPRAQAELYARIGDGYLRKKEFPQAITELRKAHELAPEATPVINSLALLLENSGNHKEARTLYEQSISRQQDNPEALNNLAYLMAETGGNLDEALTLATRAKQKLPNYTEISDTIGWIYLKKNLSDSAIDIFRELTEKVPASSTFHFHYAMAFAQKGDKANATKQLQLALANKPSKEEEGRIRELMSKI